MNSFMPRRMLYPSLKDEPICQLRGVENIFFIVSFILRRNNHLSDANSVNPGQTLRRLIWVCTVCLYPNVIPFYGRYALMD